MNPWALLGLKPGADRADIRRAYARLLKTTNPEDDPEGFMALRAAHDAALNQLQWHQQWPDEADAAADGSEAVKAAPSPPPPPAEDPHCTAEHDDLLARQEALIAAIQAGPGGQRAAFDALMAAPAMDGVATRANVENWLAGLIAGSLPASDPLVVTAIDRFGWDDLPPGRIPPAIAALLQRREEGEFVAGIARPHTDLHVGYMALSKPPGPRWWRHLGAMVSAAPAQTRSILGLVDGPLPGIADWLDADAVAAWRDWHSKVRLRLWMILTMFPLAAVVLTGLLRASGWPKPVQQGFGLLAWAAPLGLLAVLRWRQRFQDDWEQPEWHYLHWPPAVLALPLLAALWPAVPAMAPLFLAPALAAVVGMLLALDRLEPAAWRDLAPGVVRSLPAWLFLMLMIGGGDGAGDGAAGVLAPVRVLACAVLALAWWQAGDALTWIAERRLGDRAVWAPAAASAGVAALALAAAKAGWPDRGLALLPLALMGLLLSFRVAHGWWQALPAAGLAGFALMLFELLSRIDSSVPGAANALAGLADANLFFDPATRLPRPPFVTGLVVAGIALWQARRTGFVGWPLRILVIGVGLAVFLRPLVDDAPPPRRSAAPPVVAGTSAAWLSAGDTLNDAAPGDYRFRVALDVNANGRVAACRLIEGTGVVPLDQSLCPQLKANARYRPARSSSGAPAVATLELSGGWTVKAAPPMSSSVAAAAVRPPPPAPAIVCAPPAVAAGPMVAEPCMADAWIADGAYPPGPLARGESGLVRYRLFIDTAGRVERCAINGSSGHAGLDGDTCALLARRARFVPARDVDGSPMTWEYAGSVRWELAGR